MYDLLVDKLGTARYVVRYSTARKTLLENKQRFGEVSEYNQCQILFQILNLFKTTAASADLKLLCGKAGIGILLTSKNLMNYTENRFVMIHQSVTGFFEQEIDLLGDKF
jgi:CRISPR-associated endonuclease Csn1